MYDRRIYLIFLSLSPSLDRCNSDPGSLRVAAVCSPAPFTAHGSAISREDLFVDLDRLPPTHAAIDRRLPTLPLIGAVSTWFSPCFYFWRLF